MKMYALSHNNGAASSSLEVDRGNVGIIGRGDLGNCQPLRLSKTFSIQTSQRYGAILSRLLAISALLRYFFRGPLSREIRDWPGRHKERSCAVLRSPLSPFTVIKERSLLISSLLSIMSISPAYPIRAWQEEKMKFQSQPSCSFSLQLDAC